MATSNPHAKFDPRKPREQWDLPTVQENFGQRLRRFVKEQPFVVVGMLGALTSLGLGLREFKYNNKHNYQKYMWGRIGFQGLAIGAFVYPSYTKAYGHGQLDKYIPILQLRKYPDGRPAHLATVPELRNFDSPLDPIHDKMKQTVVKRTSPALKWRDGVNPDNDQKTKGTFVNDKKLHNNRPGHN